MSFNPMRILSLVLFIAITISCSQKKNELKSGTWRGVIEVQDNPLPFTFDVAHDTSGYKVYLKNGEEKILLDEISVTADSVIILLHIFDASLHAKIDGEKLTGYWIRHYAKDFRFPFTATFGDDFRFEKTAPATVDFSGKYAVTFVHEKDTTVSIGIFQQKDNHVTGTFLVPSGDYRYLEGNVVDSKLMLSAFDGNHAFVFTASKSGDILTGDYYSGRTWHETWTGIKNENATMPDPESLASLKKGVDKIDFTLPDVDGKKISLSDERFKNKVVILQVSGTWCPNCMDETKFLAPWYLENKSKGVEIIGLAYERKSDFNYASTRVKKMKKKMNVTYDYVIAGTVDKPLESAPLKDLQGAVAFPTTIFIGKDGKVKRINTGFSGPGTGVYYEQYIQHFNEVVTELLQ
jgi:peroxiredoxin